MTADRSSELVLLKRRPRNSISIQEKVIGVEDVVSEKFEQCAMKLIAPGLGNHIDVAARAASVGGIVQTGLHLELLDGIRVGNRNSADGQDRSSALGLHVSGILPVHLVTVVHDASAIDENIHGILS